MEDWRNRVAVRINRHNLLGSFPYGYNQNSLCYFCGLLFSHLFFWFLSPVPVFL
jgi:hypothetical protein